MTGRQIIIVSRFFYPDHAASSQQLTDLATDLAQHGWTVTALVCRHRSDNPAEVLPARDRVNEVEITRLWSSRFGRANLLGRAVDYLTYYFSVYGALRRMGRQVDVIVADSDPPLLSIVAAIACRGHRAKLVHLVADLYPELLAALGMMSETGKLYRLVKKLRDWSFGKGDAIIVLGEKMRSRVSECVVDQVIVRVIPNWADGQQIRPLSRDENSLREDWGLQGKFVVGYSGNMGRAHDFETVLGAAKILRERSDIMFLFIGGGARSGEIVKQTESCDLTNIMVRPYQRRENLGVTLTAPDAHLISLRSGLEGMVVPCKYYGIAAADRPVLYVGDRDGDIAQTVLGIGNGSVTAINDSENLAAMIVRLADNPVQCAQLGRRGRQDFELRFDKPVPLLAWRTFLEELVSDSRHDLA